MSLATLRRRMTKHRRTESSTSNSSDKSSSSESSKHRSIPTISAPMPIIMALPDSSSPSLHSLSRSASPPRLNRSVTITVVRDTGSETPVRRPRFTHPRAAPPPPESPGMIEHVPPIPAASPPPPVPPRAMPPWRATLITLAQSYAPFDSPAYNRLMNDLRDLSLSERQALTALRSYIDDIHQTHRGAYSSDNDSESTSTCGTA